METYHGWTVAQIEAKRQEVHDEIFAMLHLTLSPTAYVRLRQLKRERARLEAALHQAYDEIEIARRRRGLHDLGQFGGECGTR